MIELPPDLRPIPGDDGYYASPDGRIFSTRQSKLKEISQSIVRGYASVAIMRPGKSTGTRVYVHVLVCAAFHGPRPSPDHEVRHFPDGDRMNNSSGNLCWGTRLENASDRLVQGTDAKGERNSLAKLTEEDVLEIRRRADKSETLASIAASYGLSKETVGRAVRGDTWTHLPGALGARQFSLGSLGNRAMSGNRYGCKLSVEAEAEMVERRRQGEKIVVLAEAYGLSRESVLRIMRKNGLTRSKI